MKIMKQTARPTHSRSYLKHKLISATALLLVSSIMLVSTSYAWYVLSTAPEVSNIKTQVGANGALEIALLNEDSWKNLSKLDMGDIDESLTDTSTSAAVANLTWGNLVNLDDKSYGMDSIVLNPARLYIKQDGSTYKVIGNMLKTPVYGEGGRVKGLETSAVAHTYADGTFSNDEGYGVRAIGTAADMSVFQLGMNAARGSLITYAAAARTAATNTLNANGGNLATLVVDYAVNEKSDFSKKDVASILALAEGLQAALSEIETALRQAFAGYITTDGAYYVGTDGNVPITEANYQEKLAEINGPTVTLVALLEKYPGIEAVIAGTAEKKPDDIEEYIAKLTDDQAKVTKAATYCKAMIDDETATSFDWNTLADVIYPLVDTEKMTVFGMTVPQLKDMVKNGELGELIDQVMGGGGITVVVPSGSGILSNIADFANDYSAQVTVEEVSYGDLSVSNATAKMVTETGFNPTHLSDCSNKLRTATVADAAESNSITDYYGYAIDLAFRTNAEESNLLLQTDPENRIYEGENQTALQGGGSYMSFTSSAGLSVSKVVGLMEGIRVVLMDEEQNVLGIAALDTTLGRNNYEVLDAATQSETKMYAYLKGGAGDYQNSDLISQSEYEALDETSDAVQFNPTTGKVTAKLYLYNFEMTQSKDSTGAVRYEDDGTTPKYTGGLTLNSKRADAVITPLTQDVPQKVTALVYLDGSFVNNSDVAANAGISMAGTLNLQFSSSAELMPATNTELQSSSSDVVYTELSSELYEAGYLNYNNTLYKVATGYSVYEGSDGKIYFGQTVDTPTNETVTELTESIIATNALVPVTASLEPDTVSVAVGAMATLTTRLSDSNLTIEGGSLSRSDSGTDELVTYTEDEGEFTLTGATAGEGEYTATVKVKTKSGDEFTLVTDPVTITVS